MGIEKLIKKRPKEVRYGKRRRELSQKEKEEIEAELGEAKRSLDKIAQRKIDLGDLEQTIKDKETEHEGLAAELAMVKKRSGPTSISARWNKGRPMVQTGLPGATW